MSSYEKYKKKSTVGLSDWFDDFKKFLGDYVVIKKYISHLTPDIVTAPESEITVDDIK